MSLGAYLSPEPLLQSPAYVRRMAQSGLAVPPYSYGLNNPLRYTDRTGLEPDAFLPAHEALRVCDSVGCTSDQFRSEVQELQEDALKVFIAGVLTYSALEAGAAVCGAGGSAVAARPRPPPRDWRRRPPTHPFECIQRNQEAYAQCVASGIPIGECNFRSHIGLMMCLGRVGLGL